MINFVNPKYLDTNRKFQGGGNAQSSEAIPPVHCGPPRQDPPPSGEPLSFRQNSISQTRVSSIIWTLVFWPKIVTVLIFFPASTWPCSVSQWTTSRPTWLWSETYSAPTSRFHITMILKRRSLALDWRNALSLVDTTLHLNYRFTKSTTWRGLQWTGRPARRKEGSPCQRWRWEIMLKALRDIKTLSWLHRYVEFYNSF